MAVSALDIVQVVAELAVAGQQILNVWHAIQTDSSSNDDAIEDLTTELDDLYQQIYTAQSTGTTYVSINIKNLTTNTDLGSHPWPALGAGTSTGQLLPTGIAGLLTFPTIWSKVRGRKFLGGFTEDDTIGGLWRSNLTDAMELMAGQVLDGFIGSVTGNPWVWGVVKEDGNFAYFNEALVSNVPAYQRRRKVGVGS